MSESPNQNPALASLSAPRIAPETAEELTVTPLPPLVSRILIAGWILLFAVRGLFLQALIASGFFGPDLPANLGRIEKLDRIDTSLGHCYLFLLSVTLVVGVLRIVRGPGSKSDTDLNSSSGEQRDWGAQEGIAPADAGVAGAGASDQGGN